MPEGSPICPKCSLSVSTLDESESLYYCFSCAEELTIETGNLPPETEGDPYENTLETEAFSDSSPAPLEELPDFKEKEDLLIDLDEKRSKRLKTLLVASLVLCLAALAGYLGWTRLNLTEESTEKDTQKEVEVERVKVKLDKDFQKAEETAKKFLRAKTLDEAVPLVVPDPYIIKSMKHYWVPRKNEELDLEFKKMLLTQKGLKEYALFKFSLRVRDGLEKQAVVVMDKDRNFYFDWRSYEHVQDIPLQQIIKGSPDTVYMIRAVAKKTQYYNYGYKEGQYRSYQIYNPNYKTINDPSVYGFANYKVAAKLNRLRKNPNTIILLKLRWKGTHPETGEAVVEIEDIISNVPTRFCIANYSSLD